MFCDRMNTVSTRAGAVLIGLLFVTACDGYREVVTLENRQVGVVASATVICADALFVDVAGGQPCQDSASGDSISRHPLLANTAISSAEISVKGELDRRFVTVEARNPRTRSDTAVR